MNLYPIDPDYNPAYVPDTPQAPPVPSPLVGSVQFHSHSQDFYDYDYSDLPSQFPEPDVCLALQNSVATLFTISFS